MPAVTTIGDAVQTTYEMTFQWRIPDFFSLPENVNTEYASPIFTFADSNWCLILFPHGNNKLQYFSGWVSIYLMRKGICFGSSRRRVYFTLGIQTSGGVEKRDDTELEYPRGKNTEKVGIHFFWLRSELCDKKSTLLPNNTLTIICDLSSYQRDDCGVKAGGEKVARSLLRMLKSCEDSDIVIKVNDREIPAHRVILRARSAVFRDMFSCDVLERQGNVVTIEDFDLETIMELLVYIYIGSCLISMENVYSLYMAADRYNLDELKVECVKYMKTNIKVDSFCDIITLAIKHDDKELLEYAKYFFCHNSVDISKTAKWQTFLKENPTVYELIESMNFFIKAVSK